jgi:hypothetical protein
MTCCRNVVPVFGSPMCRRTFGPVLAVVLGDSLSACLAILATSRLVVLRFEDVSSVLRFED